jgi:hypothetical protein
MILMGHVANMGEMKNAYKFWSKIFKGREHLEDFGVDGMILLKWI